MNESSPPSEGLRRLLDGCVRSGWMPGAAWSVRDGDRTLSTGAVGSADAATPFDLASLTKPLVTAPLLVLVEQDGDLRLEASAQTYLSELSGSPVADASLVDLAAHRAGLPAWAPLCAQASDLDGYVESIARMPAAIPRGCTLYSDLGYVLLGAILERVTGESLDRLFRRRIAEPLGLARIGFAGTGAEYLDAAPTEAGNNYERAMAGRAGDGYSWREEPIHGVVHDANAWALGGIAGHAGLFGCVGDVAQLTQALFSGDTLSIGPAGRRRLFDSVSEEAGRTVGFVTAATSRAAVGILPDASPGHTGFTGTSVWIDRSSGRVFVLLANRIHPEVPRRDFQLVRRAFHRVATARS